MAMYFWEIPFNPLESPTYYGPLLSWTSLPLSPFITVLQTILDSLIFFKHARHSWIRAFSLAIPLPRTLFLQISTWLTSSGYILMNFSLVTRLKIVMFIFLFTLLLFSIFLPFWLNGQFSCFMWCWLAY